MRTRCKAWLRENYALVSPFLTNTSEAVWKQRCKNYGWVGRNMLQGDQFTLMAMATEFRCNINVYQSFHPVIQRPLGGVEALHDIDICLITDLHYMSRVTVDPEEQTHDDLENEVPEVSDILGDGMARPEAAGGFSFSDGHFWRGVTLRKWRKAHRAQLPRDRNQGTQTTCQISHTSMLLNLPLCLRMPEQSSRME